MIPAKWRYIFGCVVMIGIGCGMVITAQETGGETCERGGELKIVFESNRDHAAGELYIMNPDGSEVWRITSNNAVDREPQWSPDGRYIAFLRQEGALPLFKVMVMDMETGAVREVSNNGTINGMHTWSPDSEHLAFVGNVRDGADIFVVDVTDETPVSENITNSPGDDLTPDWHPDGDRIVFASNRDDTGVSDIYIINANGSNPGNLSHDPFNMDIDPRWSPDGEVIGFLSVVGVFDTSEIVGILGNGDISQITVNDRSEWELRWSPVVSPDVLQLAYISIDRDGNRDIHLMDLSAFRELTDSPEGEGHLAWSPDGTRLVYVQSANLDDDDTPKQINIIDVETGTITENIGNIPENGIDDHPAWGCFSGDSAVFDQAPVENVTEVNVDEVIDQINQYGFRAMAQADAGDLTTAVESYEQAVALAPQLTALAPSEQDIMQGFIEDVAGTVADAYRRQAANRQNTLDAIADIEAAMAIHPEPLDYFNLGVGYQQLGNTIFPREDALDTEENLQGMLTYFGESLVYYRLYLEQAETPGIVLDAQRVTVVQERIASFEAWLVTVQAIMDDTLTSCNARTRGSATLYDEISPERQVMGTLSDNQPVVLIARSPIGIGTESYWQLNDERWVGANSLVINRECRFLPFVLSTDG